MFKIDKELVTGKQKISNSFYSIFTNVTSVVIFIIFVDAAVTVAVFERRENF